MIIPRDQLSQVVDERRRIDPEWYSWFVEVTKVANEVTVLRQKIAELEARLSALGG